MLETRWVSMAEMGYGAQGKPGKLFMKELKQV